jgi:hypothetical protein
MKKHICKQCNRVYEYCRGCLLSPISYKENGYCSETCYEASKIKVEPIVEEVIETISAEDITPIEVENETVVEEEIPMVIETEAVVEEEILPVVEPTIKKETYNTYKKKKNKYKVHE